jgi:hypothetical protein
MKKPVLPFLIGLIVLTGCAHGYVIRLYSGTELVTASKPKLKDGVYQFKDAKGEEHFVPAGRVREVAPVSIAAREDKPKPIKTEPLPTKKHWYLLWLG